ncbi:uncharacterized protein LOC131685774 [Topomyia yanbarensis]|uniref:uncharacterized protein LOC131685774 n=1 Tax=Topomyia yanbarensis TaxID=2498891 RepID=UPI00273A89B7|nr:uncharacterized protein LOC131685774 [Topomyia yanbarensis]
MTSKQRLTAATAAVAVVAMIAMGLIDQGVVALDCHFCVGVDNCNVTGEEIEPVTCTEKIVHLTNESLAGFMPTLGKSPVRDREDFQCVHVKATSLTDMTFLFVRGCVFGTKSIEFCALRYASFCGIRECLACDHENRCNEVVFSSAAGRSIPNSAIAMIVSIAAATAASAVICAVHHQYHLR